MRCEDVGKRIGRTLFLAGLLLAVPFQGASAQERRGPGGRSGSGTQESQLALGYAADFFGPFRAGLSTDPGLLGNLDLLLHLDLDGLTGLRRTQLRIHVQAGHGEAVSARTGAFQGVNNLEAPEEWRLYEVWIQRQVFRRGLSILAGVFDVNSEFDVIPAVGDFLNGSFGFGPGYGVAGEAGPSTFPSTGLGARVRSQVTPSLYALMGVSDGDAGGSGGGGLALEAEDGALLSFEMGYTRGVVGRSSPSGGRVVPGGRGRRGSGERPRYGRRYRNAGRGRFLEEVELKLALGGWARTRKSEALGPGGTSGRGWGAYLLGERMLLRRSDGSGALSVFARAGTAAEEVSRLNLYLAGGLNWRGPLPYRPEDSVGFGMAHARNGDPFLRARRAQGSPMKRAETILELMYRARLGPLILQPDLQWVKDPGMAPGTPNALVFQLRGHLLLERSFGP